MTDMADRRRRRRRRKQMFSPLPLIIALGIIVFCAVELAGKAGPRWTPVFPEASDAQGYTYHSYDWSLMKEDGDLRSYEDEYYTSLQGVDVSAHQEEIDWVKVKESGIQFAYIRAGYRGYTEGGLYRDAYFEQNMKGAKDAGLLTGVYFFSQAVTVQEAEEEAEFMAEIIGDHEVDLPVVFDMERPENGDVGRTEILSRQEQTASAVAFLKKAAEAGFETMIYDSAYLFETDYDLPSLQRVRKWVAHYDERPGYPYDFEIWQYTADGDIEGISGGADLDIMFVKKN
jgi:GH25 family lysozyme M1 (1,4-beta-N-acetylmuramidase)